MNKIEEFKRPFKNNEAVIFNIEDIQYLGLVEYTFVQHSERNLLSDIKISILSDGVRFIRNIDEVKKYKE